MMKLITYTILLIVIALTYSCRKEKRPLFDGSDCTGNCFILTGKLIDSAGNVGIANGEVKFFFNDITGTFNHKKIFLGQAITDVEGNYTFKFDGTQFKNVMGYYYAEAYKKNLFAGVFYENRVSTFDLDTTMYNTPYIQNFPLFRPATLKAKIVVSNVTNFQFLTVTYSYGKVGNGIAIIQGGRQVDTTITVRTAGDLRTFVKADAVGNGVNIQILDTVLVPSNNTRQVEIRL